MPGPAKVVFVFRLVPSSNTKGGMQICNNNNLLFTTSLWKAHIQCYFK